MATLDHSPAIGTMRQEDVVARAHTRVLEALASAPTHAGHYVEDGAWKQVPVSQTSFWTDDSYDHGNWTAGFWVGALLLLEDLGAPASDELVLSVAGALATRADDETTHDLGFMFSPSAVALAERAEAAGDESAAARWSRVALTAAETLARRQRPLGNLQAFGALDHPTGQQTSTIDTMMNLPLLWWCAERFGRDDLRQIAVAHADSTLRDLVRPDGGTFHIVYRSPEGELLSAGTFQGSGDESCWTRGQSWAVHGFVSAFLATREKRFADAAARGLEFWAEHAPLDELPPYDLLADSGLCDASAGSVLASALADAAADEELASLLHAKERFQQVMAALGERALFAGDVGIIGLSTYSAPHGWGVDGALPYGDYFYLQALKAEARS